MMLSFLIVKTSSIGDIIQAFPALQYLHKKYPKASIDWVVEEEYADLVAAHPLITNVFTVGTRRWRSAPFQFSTWKELLKFRASLPPYDAVFDLQGNTKSALILSMVKAKEKVGFNWASVPEKLNFFFTSKKFHIPEGLPIQQRYLQLVQSYFKDPGSLTPEPTLLNLSEEEEKKLASFTNLPRPRFMVAFGSKWDNKRLSDEALKGFLTLVDQKHHPYFFFIWGSEKEKKVAEELQQMFKENSTALGALSLSLWQRLMFEMDLVIAMDSAALHLAGTTKTPSFSVFGPSLASIYKPLGPQHAHIQGSCPYNRTFGRRCPVLRTCPTGACIRDLSAEEVFINFP